MPVITCPTALFNDVRNLEQFLFAFQSQSIENHDTQILSFSQEIGTVDLLAFLDAIAQPNQFHFYWENQSQKVGVIGYGKVRSLTVDSPDRFIKAQQFISDCFQKTIRIGDFCLSGSEPHLFCSFTFFNSGRSQDICFSPATIFLPRFQIVKRQDRCILVINFAVDKNHRKNFNLEKIRSQIKSVNWQDIESLSNNHESHKKLMEEAEIFTNYNFKLSVVSALNAIQENHFSKLVLAHALNVISPTSFNLIQSLNHLRHCHPDCYTFSLSNGKGYYFIGASPERLISIQNQQLVTDALAGSAPRGKTAAEDTWLAQSLLRSEKEKREHQAVSEFITQRLCQLGLNPQRSPRKLLKLSNIQHLWTPIYAQVPPHLHPLEIVSHLHPTPAVAGVPTDVACEQIRHYESFDRSLYAAPLGWIDYHGNSEFIVGIRSALIEGKKARLYAGAGIVAGSDPNKELAEIQLKFQALLNALR
jgi:menaquinone-specific isochorismate synthase